MLTRVVRSWILLTVLAAAFVGVVACGGSDEPDLPDTTAASVVAYLDEVDYQASWETWARPAGEVPGYGASRLPADGRT